MLGEDGAGLDIALATCCHGSVLSAASSVGLMEAVTARPAPPGLDPSSIWTSRWPTALWRGMTTPGCASPPTKPPPFWPTRSRPWPGTGRRAASVLEVKAAAERPPLVTDLAMKVCGGAAFRKELGWNAGFGTRGRPGSWLPRPDALLDFVGRAINGLPLL